MVHGLQARGAGAFIKGRGVALSLATTASPPRICQCIALQAAIQPVGKRPRQVSAATTSVTATPSRRSSPARQSRRQVPASQKETFIPRYLGASGRTPQRMAAMSCTTDGVIHPHPAQPCAPVTTWGAKSQALAASSARWRCISPCKRAAALAGCPPAHGACQVAKAGLS